MNTSVRAAVRYFWSRSSTGTEKKARLSSKIGAYLKNIANDYKMVAIETGQDMREAPVKSAIILSSLSGMFYLITTNPTETDFHETLQMNSNDILLVGDPIRNAYADSYMRRLRDAYNARRLRRTTFGVCSIMWLDDHSRDCDTYESRCKHTRVGFRGMFQRVVDVGYCGKWHWIKDAMLDYDINPDEWR